MMTDKILNERKILFYRRLVDITYNAMIDEAQSMAEMDPDFIGVAEAIQKEPIRAWPEWFYVNAIEDIKETEFCDKPTHLRSESANAYF